MTISTKKRIWGWMSFDWASQPYHTLGLTFIFGPYFALVASNLFLSQGMGEEAAKAQAQSTWGAALTIAGFFVAFTAPFLGAFADHTGRKRPWLLLFSAIYVSAAWSLWYLTPDANLLLLFLAIFFIGFIAAELSLSFVNAYLPSLGTESEVGKISGSGAAIGYLGGLVSLIIMLLLFSENGDTGKTIAGITIPFGLDPAQKEGTRVVGPFMAIWYAIFVIPFFLWVKDKDGPKVARPSKGKIWSDLKATIGRVAKRRSTSAFLVSSMLYRDALNALYAFGAIYAAQVLGWEIMLIGIFGIVSVITAALFTYLGGLADARVGPKPVIVACVLALIAVSVLIVGMSRTQVFGFPLPAGSNLPDIIMFACGCVIGGAGGAVQAASRTMMVRHTNPDRPTEAFGLYALSGKATAFLAPMLITLFTWITGNVQLGFLPVIFLFLLGLLMLSWVNKDGDRAEWSAS